MRPYEPTHKPLASLLAVALMLLCNALSARADHIREYTEEHPLIIVSDWEFPPYEFRNDNGKPDGFNVEVLNLIFKRLGIPHKFVMQEWFQAEETFRERKADLIHALSGSYMRKPYSMTQNMITYYRLVAARRKDTPPIMQLDLLTDQDTILLKRNDYAALQVQQMGEVQFHTEYHSPREALIGIRNGKYKYYIWGEGPLNLKIRELGIDNIVTEPVDIPTGELRIIGYDKELIDAIDDTYARLEQSGEMEHIRNKWFHPERLKDDTSPITLLFLAGIILAGITIFPINRIIKRRVKKGANRSYELNQMMSKAIDMGKHYVVEYDIHSKRIRNLYGNLLPKEGMSVEAYAAHLHPDEQEVFIKEIQEKNTGEGIQPINRHWNFGTEESPDWHIMKGHTITEMDKDQPRFLIKSFRDVTDEIREEQANIELGTKYQQLFDTNIMPMSIYDAKGNHISSNQKMYQLLGLDKPEVISYFKKLNLFNAPLIKNQVDPNGKEDFHVCQHMLFPEVDIDLYLEFKLRRIYNADNEVDYYMITSRDITEERKIYQEQQKHEREMLKRNADINEYEEELIYLLENSQMWVWQSDLKKQTMKYSKSLKKTDLEESIDDYVSHIFPGEQEASRKALNDPKLMTKDFSVIHHYTRTHYTDKPAWIAVNGTPAYDKEGNQTGYFGIMRDVTKLIEVQNQLKKETERAENSGKLKSTFIANMSHEIRTPLNAIVGFSELLPTVETNEERLQFIHIIRNNCDMLMRLINDILVASNMDQALTIHPTDVDLAKSFDDICQTLGQRFEGSEVTFIKENPYDTFQAYLDIGRIQQILTNFITNAQKYTKEGHIKLGYREQEGGIYFYCEDTGAGIPKEQQASVFDRFVKLNDFVQGTGLGLSICKAIAERGGGRIGVISEGEGKGSTFWLWIPREAMRHTK